MGKKASNIRAKTHDFRASAGETKLMQETLAQLNETAWSRTPALPDGKYKTNHAIGDDNDVGYYVENYSPPLFFFTVLTHI